MKIKTYFLSIIILLLLVSCSKEPEMPFDDPTAGITVTADQGEFLFTTSLEEELSLMLHKETNYLLNPLVHIDQDKIYVIYRHDEDTRGRILSAETVSAEDATDYHAEEVILYTYADGVLSENGRIPMQWGDTKAVNVSDLYVNEETGEIHLYGRIRGRDGVLHYRFDMEGRLLSETVLPESVVLDIQNYLLRADCIYYFEYDSGNIDYFGNRYLDVLRYDMADGQTELILEDVSQICLCDGELYYIRFDGTEDGRQVSTKEFEQYRDELYKLYRRNLYRYDFTAGTHTKIAPFNTGEAVYEMVVTENSVYFTDYDSLYCYDIVTEETVRLTESTESLSYLKLGSDCLSFSVSNCMTAVYSLPETPVSVENLREKLTLAKYSPDSFSKIPEENTLKILRQNGFNAVGEWGYTSADLAEYTNTMAKKLMAGDKDFDLFYVSTEMAGLFDAAYYEDLSKYSLLNGYFDRMQPGAKDICSIDGLPCLIPVDLYTFMNRADTSYLTGEYNLPQTLEEFVQFKDQVTLENGSYLFSGNRAFVVFQPLFEQFAANLMNRTVSDREAKQDLTLLYETVYDLMQDDTAYLGDGGTRKNHVFEFVQNRGDFNLKENQNVMPILKVSEDYGETWHGGFWAVNPNSENKTLAVIFLACMIEDELANDRELSQLYRGERTDAGEVYDLYLNQLASGVRGYQIPDFKSYLRDQFEQLESGGITAAEAADLLWRYLKMVRDE